MTLFCMVQAASFIDSNNSHELCINSTVISMPFPHCTLTSDHNNSDSADKQTECLGSIPT